MNALTTNYQDLQDTLKRLIQSSEHANQQTRDFEDALEACQNWIMRMTLRLVEEKNSLYVEDQHSESENLVQDDFKKNDFSLGSDRSNYLSGLQRSLLQHQKVSDEIIKKSTEVNRVHLLGQRLLSSGLLGSDTGKMDSVTQDLISLRQHYDDLCDKDTEIKNQLEESILLVMERFLNCELASWWLNNNSDFLSEERHSSLLLVEEEAKDLLIKLDSLWSSIKPLANKYQSAADNLVGADPMRNQLAMLSQKLSTQAQVERKKLNDFIQRISLRRRDLLDHDTKKNNLGKWLMRKRQAWIHYMSQFGYESDLDAHLHSMKSYLDELRLKEGELNDLHRSQSNLQSGHPPLDDPILDRLTGDFLDFKRSLEAEMNLAERRKQTTAMEEQLRMKEELIERKKDQQQRMRRQEAARQRQAKSTQTSQTVAPGSLPTSDSEDLGLRNSGGNRGISKHFWPYASQSDRVNSKSMEDVSKMDLPLFSSTTALKLLLENVKDIKQDYDNRVQRQPPPPTALSSLLYNKRGPSSVRSVPAAAPQATYRQLSRSPSPRESVRRSGSACLVPGSIGSCMTAPYYPEPINNLTYGGRPPTHNFNSIDMKPPASNLPRKHISSKPPIPSGTGSGMNSVHSRPAIDKIGRGYSYGMAPDRYRPGASSVGPSYHAIESNRRTLPVGAKSQEEIDDDRLWRSLEKASDSARDLRKLSEKLQQMN